MSNVVAILANIPVPDLDAAVPFYQRLTGADEVVRFEFGALHVARVGTFLLTEGRLEGWSAQQHVTVVVKSIQEITDAAEAGGAEVLEGPHHVPNGTRLIVRHPDGAVVEYMQPRT
jgi:predicted enzyme related to lactoylglutathione lyase